MPVEQGHRAEVQGGILFESVATAPPFSYRSFGLLTLIGWITGAASVGVLMLWLASPVADLVFDADAPAWLVTVFNAAPAVLIAIPGLAVTLPLLPAVAQRPALRATLAAGWFSYLAASLFGWSRLYRHFVEIGDDGWAGDGLVLLAVGLLMLAVLVVVPAFNITVAGIRTWLRRERT